MAKKNKSLANWGSILGIIGGIIEIVVGVLWLIGNILEDIISIFNTANWLGGNLGLDYVIAAIILIVIGAVSVLLALGRFGLDYVVIGILLIVLGIVGGGIGGLLVLIGGILFLIAGL
ncbi:MAG: hypothetical protein H7641_11695 [Candidatus Heimdallarchaeota archaeon]|nr:hypothetical protein [Candidatus Heimdallarchaeota archaeon]MCK4878223.1 hypothetical protein [Candidatus Heimdallarchaeota archaeon]